MIRTVEDCSECGEETEHSVSIEVRQESEKYYSREPYRFTECVECGFERVEKINS